MFQHPHMFQTRFAMRRLLRSPDTTADQKAQLQIVLDDDDAIGMVAEQLTAQHQNVFGGKVSDFFQWLLDHSDQIFAVIAKLLPLILSIVTVVGT